MRARFTADYDHVEPMRTVSFRAGAETSDKAIAAAAIAAGRAEEIKPAPKPKADDAD